MQLFIYYFESVGNIIKNTRAESNTYELGKPKQSTLTTGMYFGVHLGQMQHSPRSHDCVHVLHHLMYPQTCAKMNSVH